MSSSWIDCTFCYNNGAPSNLDCFFCCADICGSILDYICFCGFCCCTVGNNKTITPISSEGRRETDDDSDDSSGIESGDRGRFITTLEPIGGKVTQLSEQAQEVRKPVVLGSKIGASSKLYFGRHQPAYVIRTLRQPVEISLNYKENNFN